MSQEKKHHHLVTAQIVFKADNEDNIGSAMTNALFISDMVDYKKKDIGNIQVAAQMAFHQKLDGAVVQIIDVVIINIVYLGYFTEEEFQAAPEGTTEVQVPSQVQ